MNKITTKREINPAITHQRNEHRKAVKSLMDRINSLENKNRELLAEIRELKIERSKLRDRIPHIDVDSQPLQNNW